MPEWLSIVLLGVIEGLTEFIPVSSTGHLLIAEQFLWRQSELFNVVIQCGAVLAVIPLFWPRLNQFLTRSRDPATRDYLLKVLAAFFITGVGGFILTKAGFKLPKELLPVALALLVGGVLFLVVESWIRKRPVTETVSWSVAIAVGIAQLVAAVFPGASRSGTTILIALILGLSRPAAAEFSFLVGIPTMLAAGGYEMMKAIRHPEPGAPAENWGMVLLGTVVAAAVSFAVVKWLLGYIRNHTFTAFGWYRIVFGLVLLGFVWRGHDKPAEVKPRASGAAPNVAVHQGT